MLLSAMTSADGSIWLNITKRQVRDLPSAGIDHPDALTAGRRSRGCAWVTCGGPQGIWRVIPPGAGWSARSCRQGKTRGPASASRGSRLRGARTRARYPASSRGSLVIASPPLRGSARHRPRSHVSETFGRPPRRPCRRGAAGGTGGLHIPRADGQPRRGGRPLRHRDGIEPSHRVRLPRRMRPARTAAPAGWVRAQASRAMKMRTVTSAKQRTMAGSSPTATGRGSR